MTVSHELGKDRLFVLAGAPTLRIQETVMACSKTRTGHVKTLPTVECGPSAWFMGDHFVFESPDGLHLVLWSGTDYTGGFKNLRRLSLTPRMNLRCQITWIAM